MLLDEYTLIKSVGKGAFGEVFLTSKEGSNQLFATKKVSKQKADSPQIKKYFYNEITILKEIKHKNIIHFESLKHTIHNYYIITEFCNGGGLSECLEKYMKLYRKPFSEQIVQHIMRQIVDALKYLHGKRIIHRDIKLDNILVNFDKEEDKNKLNMLNAQIKLIDFGFATHLGNKNLRYSTLGSPINMDPILLKKLAIKGSIANLIGYDEKADIWSLGTVCYEMLIGQGVFNAQNMIDLIKKVEKGTYHVPTNLSVEVVSFLNGMLQYSAKNRLSAEELSRHHFLTKNVKDFKKIDLTKVSNKIDNKGLNINIKRNQSIWAIFKEEDDKALINISGNYLNPIIEQEESPQNKNNPFKNKLNGNMDNKNNLNTNKNMNINNKNEIINNKINQVNINYNNNQNNGNFISANKNINNNKTNITNNNQNLKTKEKVIDYDLLKQQQKLYYQLNLKNKNYHRFANYTYNNPYGFGGANSPNINYIVNNKPVYYNANINGVNQINPQPYIPIQQGQLPNNILSQSPRKNQILINQQQYPQYQNPYGNQPPIINVNNQQQIPIVSNGYQQQQPKITQNPINNQNILIKNPVLIPNNNKDETEKSKITLITDKTAVTKAIPKGSRMPQQIAKYFSNNSPQVNTEYPKQNQNNYNQIKNQQQIKQEKNQTNVEIKNIKDMPQFKKNEFSNEKRFSTKTPTKNHNNNIDIQNLHRIKTNVEQEQIKEPQNNPRHHKNENSNNKNQPQKQFVDINDNKNQNKDINTYSNSNKDNKNEYKGKSSNKIKRNNYEKENQPVIDDKMKIPLDGDENENDDNNNEILNEPFPMPDNEDFPNEKKDSDELDNLIDFKLGDELVTDSDIVVDKDSNELNDNEDNNNMDLPMQKIMDRTVERPTIGVPPPGTDPKDNYEEEDDNNNGIFQNKSKLFFENDNDDILEI